MKDSEIVNFIAVLSTCCFMWFLGYYAGVNQNPDRAFISRILNK